MGVPSYPLFKIAHRAHKTNGNIMESSIKGVHIMTTKEQKCTDALNTATCQAPEGKIIPETESLTTATAATFNPLGTKWLKFWNYFSLPVGGAFGLLMSFGIPTIGFILVPIAILQFMVAYGLHNRKIWAWQLNWVLILLSCLIPRAANSSIDFWAQLIIIQIPLFGLIWMWPNYVYWKKRRVLFS
jgi:hypothetical protein